MNTGLWPATEPHKQCQGHCKPKERRLERAVGVELRPIEPERLQEPLAHERRIALVGNLLQDPAQDDRVHARIQGTIPGGERRPGAVRRRSG
jgi:hypothetical protein